MNYSLHPFHAENGLWHIAILNSFAKRMAYCYFLKEPEVQTGHFSVTVLAGFVICFPWTTKGCFNKVVLYAAV